MKHKSSNPQKILIEKNSEYETFWRKQSEEQTIAPSALCMQKAIKTSQQIWQEKYKDIDIEKAIEEFKKASIPETEFERMFTTIDTIRIINIHFSGYPDELLAERRIPWIWGNLEYFNLHKNMADDYQHIDEIQDINQKERIQAYIKDMLICAGCSGNIEALRWVLDNRLIAPWTSFNTFEKDTKSDDEYCSDGETFFLKNTINPAFSSAILCSKNIETLKWAFDHHLIEPNIRSLYLCARLSWLKGFQWLANQFMQDMPTGKTLNHEKLMKNIENLKAYGIRLSTRLPIQLQLQWLSGNMDYYHLYENWQGNREKLIQEMVLCAALSGDLEALNRVFDSKLVDTEKAGFRFTPFQTESGIFKNYFFSLALVLSKNIEALAWGLSKKIIEKNRTPKNTASLILHEGWLEGLQWIDKKHPLALSSLYFKDDSNPNIVNYPPVLILAKTKHLHLLDWCLQNRPALLLHRDRRGYTMVHIAAEYGVIPVLDWFSRNFPCLFQLNDNNEGLSIMHIGVSQKDRKVLEWGDAYDKNLASIKSKNGSNIATWLLSLSWGDLENFNYAMSLVKKPFSLSIKKNEVNALKRLDKLMDNQSLCHSICSV